MASASTQDLRYFDKATGKIYRAVLMNDGTVLLEGDDSAQILTTTLRLVTHYDLITAHQ